MESNSSLPGDTMSAMRTTLLLAFLTASLAPPLALVAQQQSPTPVTVAPATLQSYVGQYRDRDEPDNFLSVFRDHDHLYIEAARTPRTDLTAKSATVFTLDNGS